MNLVLDDAVEEKAGGEKARLGMVVSLMQAFIIEAICDSLKSKLTPTLILGDSR
jgi:hypothetical protein